jgi:hypothetical protein
MGNTYTAITRQDGDWWIGWIEEVPGVNWQERTRAELLGTLRVTLREIVQFDGDLGGSLCEVVPRQDDGPRSRAGGPRAGRKPQSASLTPL